MKWQSSRGVCLARVAVGVVGNGGVELYGIRFKEALSGNQREPVRSASAAIRYGNCKRIAGNGNGPQFIIIRAPLRGGIDPTRTKDDVPRLVEVGRRIR